MASACALDMHKVFSVFFSIYYICQAFRYIPLQLRAEQNIQLCLYPLNWFWSFSYIYSWHFNFVIHTSGVLGPYQFQRRPTMLIWWRLEPVITWLKKNMIRARAHISLEGPRIEPLRHLLGQLRFMQKLERLCISPRQFQNNDRKP